MEFNESEALNGVSGNNGRLTLGEACEAIGVPPSTFRQILADFKDLVEDGHQDEDVATLSPLQVEQLRAVNQWRGEGVSASEIRLRLQGAHSEIAAATATLSPEEILLQQMEGVQKALERSEQRRVEDRDRMLTALMRTQQEIQRLSYSLAANSSRRDRKRTGLFGRLFR
ncbi:MAG: hypothetical protein ACYC5Y_12830 [Symbiobacteriia bacterium]